MERLCFLAASKLAALSANVNGLASTWALEIELNSDADAAAVSALVNAIAYENSNGSFSGTRVVDFVLEDGDGGTSAVTPVRVIIAANVAPDSNSITEGFTEDTTAEITVSGTDSDGTVAEIRILTLPDAAHGVLYTDAGENNPVISGSTYATTDGSLTLFFVPDADFNGDASFEFAAIDDQGLEGPAGLKSLEGTAVNDAPVLAIGTNPQFDSITEDDIDNAGETVGSLLLKIGDPITDVDGDPEGIAVTNNNGNGGTWQYSTDEGANWFDVGPVSTANALLLRDTDLLRLNPDGEQGTNANLGFRAWDQSGSTEGAEGTFVDVTPTGTDSPFSTQALSAQIEVTDVNDAPVLDNAGENTLTSIDENNFDSSGDLVRDIIASAAGNPDGITDVDADPREGIAIFKADSVNGTWEYSSDGGTTWTGFGTPSATAALLLTDEALVRFVPTEGFSGEETFSYRAWDQTTPGEQGDSISLNDNTGGTGSLSVGLDTARITVTKVDLPHQIDLNDATAGENNTVTYTENDSPILVAPNAIVEDFGENDIVSLTITGDVFDSADNELRINGMSFIPGEDISHEIVVNGQTLIASTAGGGIIVSSSAGADTPIQTSNVQSIIQGLTFRSESDGINTDDQIDIQFTATDLAGQTSPLVTSTISLVGVNDSPELDDTEAADFSSINEDEFDSDGTAIAAILASSVSDQDGNPEGIAIFNADQTNGIFEYSLDGATEYVAFGEVSESSALLLDATTRIRFVPAPDYNGDATISFRAWDQTTTQGEGERISVAGNFGGTNSLSTGRDTATIIVNPVNDAPVTGGFEEIYLADLTPSFNDGALSLVANAGHNNAEIDINGQTFFQGVGIHPTVGGSVTEYDLNGATSFTAIAGVSETISGSRGRVSFRILVDGVEVFDSGLVTNGTPAIPISIDTTGGDVLRFEVDSEGGQGFDHFVLADAVLTGGETQPTTISVAESAVDGTVIGTYQGSDPDVGDTLTYSLFDSAGGRFAIDPDTGVITVADSSQFDFESTDSYSIVVRIDDEMVTTDDTVTINLTDVNDAPTGTDGAVSLPEDGSHSFSVADFGFADSEGDTLNSIRIESLPTEGTLTLNGVAVNEGITIKTPEFPNLVYTPAADFNGSDSFNFTVEDLRQKFATNSNTLTFNVESVNDDPVAVDDVGFTTAEDTPITIAFSDLLANDSDVDGDTLEIDARAAEINGIVQLNDDETFTFTPDADFSGVASFDYFVNDGKGGTDRATVEIIVGSANDDPLAVDDSFTTFEDTSVTILPSDLLDNDSDPDGDTLQLVAVDANSPTNGTLQVNGDGSFTYTPNENFFGSDSFTYGITDGNGGTAQATVNIEVNSVNDAPVAVNDSFVTSEENSLIISASELLANDSDVDGDTLNVNFTPISGPANGTLSVNSVGSFNYTPDADFNGTDSFIYEVSDTDGLVARATVVITVNPVNDGPTTSPVTLTPIAEDSGTVTITQADLLVNSDDRDGDPLFAVGLTNTSGNGTLVDNEDGTWSYTPDADDDSSVSFSYDVTDNTVNVANTATLDITPVNDAPVIGGFNETRLADLTPSLVGPNVSFTDNAGHNDAQITINGQDFFQGIGIHPVSPSSFVEYDLNGATEFSAVIGLNDTLFQAGEVVFRAFVDGVEVFNSTDLAGGNVTTDTPALSVSVDTTGGSTLRLVVESAGVQGADHAVWADAVLTGPTQVTTISLAESAVNGTLVGTYSGSDVDGDTLTYSLDDSAGGRFTIDADTGEITVADASQLDFETANSHSITVKIDDGMSTTLHSLQIELSDINEAPTGTDNTISILEDGSRSFSAADFGFSDPEGGELRSILLVTRPSGGTLELNGNLVTGAQVIDVADLPNLVYRPNADANGLDYDSFDFQVRDAGQQFAEESNTLTFDVIPVNDAPTGTDNTITLAEDGIHSFVPSDFGFSDIDGDAFQSVRIIEFSGSGTLTLGGVNIEADTEINLSELSNLTYTPAPNENGDAVGRLTFQVRDDGGAASGGVDLDPTLNVITFNISPVNDAPVAINDRFATSEDVALTITTSDLLSNDSDADGDPLQVNPTLVDTPSNGTVTFNGDGALIYTPDANFVGTDSFVYSVSDGNGGTAQATVEIAVNAANDLPVAVADQFIVNEDSLLNNLDLLANDFDIDGDPLEIIRTSTPSEGGTLQVNDDGTVNYTPVADFFGTETFEYEISDGNGGFSTSTVTIDVLTVNDTPAAVQDFFTVLSTESQTFDESVLANDFDVEGSLLMASLVTGPENGTLMLAQDGTFTYAANAGFVGVDSFVYLASDGDSSSQAIVEITVLPNAITIDSPSTDNNGGSSDDGSTTDDSNDLMMDDMDTDNESTETDTESNDSSSITSESNLIINGTSVTVSNRQGANSLNGVSSELQQASSESFDSFGILEASVATVGDSELDLNNFIQSTVFGNIESGIEGTGLEIAQLQSHLQFASSIDMQMMFDSLEAAEKAGVTMGQLEITVGSLATFGTVGFVLWTLRGGALAGLALSQLPTWQMMDPLPILDSYKDKESEAGDEQEQVAELFAASSV